MCGSGSQESVKLRPSRCVILERRRKWRNISGLVLVQGQVSFLEETYYSGVAPALRQQRA